MRTLRSLARPLAALAALAITAAPLIASAEPQGRRHDPRHRDDALVSQVEFRRYVERSIDRERMLHERFLASRRVPEYVKEHERLEFEARVMGIRSVAGEAMRDGKVTRREARQVHILTSDLSNVSRVRDAHQGHGHAR